MRTRQRVAAAFLPLLVLFSLFSPPQPVLAQSIAHTGSITGTVKDSSGAVMPGATVTIRNPVSQYLRTSVSDSAGQFQFTNVPFNPYQLSVVKSGFSSVVRDVDVRSGVPVVLPVELAIGTASTTIQVTSSDLLENDTTMHTDVDRNLFGKVPLESQSSSLSSLVTLASPGVAADSNGLFHGLGDHASNSFSVDGQPITDQQSKVFSNQLPASAVQSMEVIDGAPPAEYGDKTSLVIDVTTRSGQGLTRPTGSIYTSYGSFGSTTEGFDVGYGKKNWGNFLSADGLNTSRFLDPPEFAVFHDKGNEENFFDRVDYAIDAANSLHLNLNYSRSWFQTPNAYDNLNLGGVNLAGFAVNGPADQRSKIGTFDIAPSYTRVLNQYAVFNFGLYLRKDVYHYYPSTDPFADLGPIQQQSIGQDRSLANYGAHADLSWVKGAQNVKIGAVYEQTFLRESDRLGVIDPGYLDSLTGADGNPCMGPDGPIADPCTSLYPYDLTRGGTFYDFRGHTDVKELALYAEDQITKGPWLFRLGMRGDIYNGLAAASQAEPRLGISYRLQPTHTVLRVSYARTLETPFNENLVLSSRGCLDSVVNPLLACSAGDSGALTPGFRNEFHAGLQQAFGRHVVMSGDYIWKYTHDGYDFSVLGNTPITFPIEWHNSKIPGFALRADLTQFHNLTAYVVMSSVAARFFPPQVGGAGATVGQSGYPFRIDHDEKYNQTSHIQYQLPWKHTPWYSFNWRYDSGLVAGSVPCYNTTDPNSLCNPANGGPSITLPDGRPGIDLSGLTPDQQFEAGLTCDGVRATPSAGFATCDAAGLTSKLVQIPAPGTENDDHAPPRIQPRNLFDMALGEDNLFHGEHYKWGTQVTVINVTNKYALYNFLSTFSGTHYVTPRAVTGQISFSF